MLNANNSKKQSSKSAQAETKKIGKRLSGVSVQAQGHEVNVSTGAIAKKEVKSLKISVDDIEKSVPFPEDNQKVVEAFGERLKDIKAAGDRLQASKEGFEKNYKAAAISDLGKILGIYIKYFSRASSEMVELLKQKLKEECGIGKNKNGKEFHLLSRVYRGNDRKQASADAKVLRLAFEANIGESNFAEWVSENKGLDKIKKSVVDYTKDKMNERPPLPRTAGQQKALFRRAEEAIVKVAKAKQTQSVYSVSKDKSPELFEKLRPQGSAWRVLVVNVDDDDQMFFHGLYEYRVDHGQKGNIPVNVDGTSMSTWPKWLVSGKPESDEQSNEDSNDVQGDTV